MKKAAQLVILVDRLIHQVRGQRIILDVDLAFYGVQTFRFNEAV